MSNDASWVRIMSMLIISTDVQKISVLNMDIILTDEASSDKIVSIIDKEDDCVTTPRFGKINNLSLVVGAKMAISPSF